MEAPPKSNGERDILIGAPSLGQDRTRHHAFRQSRAHKTLWITGLSVAFNHNILWWPGLSLLEIASYACSGRLDNLDGWLWN
jgi:hypothetical protein